MTITVDAPPAITITASEVSNGATSNDATLSLAFTTSETTTDFDANDITVTNGSISSFSGSGTSYTATFTPTSQGATTIDVLSGKFTDTVGNSNTASAQFNWTYDSTAPTIAIAASEVSDGATSSDATLSLTFTTSETTADFDANDITVTNGSISSFSGSGTSYTATFTPTSQGATTIDVVSGKFTDTAGNGNTASAQFGWIYDATSPTFDVAPSVGSVTSSGFTPSASIDEAGTIYYVVVADGATAPSVAQVTAGQDSTGSVALASDSETVSSAPFSSSFSAVTTLSEFTAYDVYFVAQDNASTPNVQASLAKVDATTLDATAPTLSSSTPSDDASGIALADNIVLTFSESVQAGTGNITISGQTSGGSSDTRAIAIGDAQVSISGSTVTINPTADLLPSTSYNVQIASTAIDDLAGNSFAGISDTTTLNFDTGSIASPPTSLSASVASGQMSLSFSAPSGSGTSPITEYQYQLDGGSWVSTSSTSTSINITGLTNGSTYSVKVRGVTSIGPGLESSALSVTIPTFDANLVASATVSEPVGIGTTVDTVGEAVDLFDFTISDGGGDGLATTISQIVVNVSGTASDAVRDQITWRLDGPDASNVTGTYNASNDTITFTGLSISIADGSSETYTINGYFNDNTNVTEDQTIILSVDGDTDLTVGASGTQFAATTAVNNSTGTTVDVVATTLAVTTQPAGSVSGSALTTQPVVTAQDDFGNTDVDFTETITLTEASAGTLSGDVDVAAVAGVATFTDVTYTATADQESFILTADDQNGVGSDLSAVSANAITSDVVATKLAFSTQPAPLAIEHGTATAFTTVPVVDAQDANGITDTGYTTNITISEVNGVGSATLSASGDTDGSSSTVSIAPVNGVAVFAGMSITYSASGSSSETLNLQASSGALTTATSSQITSSDTTAPTITSVTVSSAGSYKAGDTLEFTVNTSETVTVSGGPPKIAFNIDGGFREALYVSGTGSTALLFRYTVQSGDVGAVTQRATVMTVNGAAIRDGANNQITSALNNFGDLSGVIADGAAPTISIQNAPTTVNSTSAFSVTFEFSEDVTGFAVGDITVTNGTAGNFVTVDGNTYTADITPSAGGNVAIDVAANVAQDGAGNTNTAATQVSVTYDATAPTISSVSVPSNGTYRAGQTLSFTVNTSENVTVITTGGTPEIALTIGSTTRQATYVSGSASTALLFSYTVQSGDEDADGIAVGSLSGNGGTLKDSAGNDLNLTLNSVGSTSSVLVNATVPAISSVSLSADNSSLTVTFSEAVYGTSGGSGDLTAADFALSITGGTATVTSTPSSITKTSQSVWVLGVGLSGAPDGSEIVSVVPVSATSIYDVAGNPASTTQSNNTATLNDQAAPTATFNPTNGATDIATTANIAITFNEAVRLIDNTALSDANVDALITLKDTGSSGSNIAFDATVSGNVITITPTSDFDTSQVVYVAIGATIEDSSDNAYAGGSAIFTVTANIASPASDFAENEAVIRSIIIDDMMRAVRSGLNASTRMIRDARNRLIADDRCRDEDSQSDDRCTLPTLSTRSVPLEIEGVASADAVTLSTRGTATASLIQHSGAYRRLFFSDFDIQHDLDRDDTTATLSARLAWEHMVRDGTLLGYYVGAEAAESDLKGTFAGDQTRLGLSVGGYVAHRLAQTLYTDAYISIGVGHSDLDISNGTLALESDYRSETVTAGASISGAYVMEAYEFRPELAFNYGKSELGTVFFTGRAYGLVDDTLSLNAGSVSIANLTLRPEVIYTLEDGLLANTNATLSFAPRLICERTMSTRRTENCGSGGEVGFSAQSDDGLRNANFRFAIDKVGSARRSTAALGLEMRF
ncbi:Ig-like domain-containing protein [Roseovarius sp. 10]|uniref:beta strand repeat-containing protein n=1 Tax=Roseovarius sp. 10 TaxID=3080563 RepID=UPI0029544CC7|nr:Ig-like domain-containing protein [Roseovarius sp. 10]MDV7202428.1 Ig-like domain-containing protein [Roseovarius sp. 10]